MYKDIKRKFDLLLVSLYGKSPHLNSIVTKNYYQYCGSRDNMNNIQLVEQNAHLGIPNSGGVSQYKAATGKSYTHPARFGGKKSCPYC